MNQYNLHDTATEIIRETLRKGDVLQNGEALQTVPELVSCVKVSQVRLSKMLERVLENKNPLNSILGLLGFQLVNTRKLNQQEQTVLVSNGQNLDRILTIDRSKFEEAVDKLAGLLAEQEKSQGEESRALRQKYNEISRELDTVRLEAKQLAQEHDAARRAIAERVQYLLSLCGPGGQASSEAGQLNELLSDVDLEAVWPGESLDAALFTVIRTEDPEKHRTKPCIRGNGQIVAKGACFVLPEAADKPAAVEAPEA